jgi:hypothetical protein
MADRAQKFFANGTFAFELWIEAGDLDFKICWATIDFP